MGYWWGSYWGMVDEFTNVSAGTLKLCHSKCESEMKIATTASHAQECTACSAHGAWYTVNYNSIDVSKCEQNVNIHVGSSR